MTKDQAFLILSTIRPLLRDLACCEFTPVLSKINVESLQSIREVAGAGFLEDAALLKDAGYSIVEAALLLGILNQAIIDEASD